MTTKCDPQDELKECVRLLIAETAKLNDQVTKHHLHELGNSLNRIERWARTGGYCIFDIADMT